SRDAGRLTWSLPHSVRRAGGRSGPDTDTITPSRSRRDLTTRSAGGAVTVSVRLDGCGPSTRTTRRVRPPGGPGTTTVRPAAGRPSGPPGPGGRGPAARRRGPARPAASYPGRAGDPPS